MTDDRIGYYTGKQIEYVRKTIRLVAPKISMENSTEDVLDALEIINRATWEAKQSIIKELSGEETNEQQ